MKRKKKKKEREKGERGRQTDRHACTQAGRQTDRQADRQTEIFLEQSHVYDAFLLISYTGATSSESLLLLLVGCLTSHQHASVSQGRICTDNFMCCHTEIEVADPTFYLTQSQYTDTRPTSPSADPIVPGTCQGCHWRITNDLQLDRTKTELRGSRHFLSKDRQQHHRTDRTKKREVEKGSGRSSILEVGTICVQLALRGVNARTIYLKIIHCSFLQLFAAVWKKHDSQHQDQRNGRTRGVTVSTSAFLACLQRYCAGSSLACGLNLWTLVCGIF